MFKVTWGIFSPFHLYVKEKAVSNIREVVSTDTMPAHNSAVNLKIKSIFWFCISPVQVSGQFQGVVSAILWIFSLSFSSFIFGRKYSPWFIWLENPFLSWPLFSSLQWYLYICLSLLSSSCNSDGICDTVGEEETCWPLLWWSRRNGQMIRELAYGRGKAILSLTSTSAFLSFADPEWLLEWHREWRQLPDDATKGSSWPHCVLHALLLLATGNCCLLPVPWGNVKTFPARHSQGQWKVVQGDGIFPTWICLCGNGGCLLRYFAEGGVYKIF